MEQSYNKDEFPLSSVFMSSVLMSGVNVISIHVRSCISVSVFTHHLSLTPGRILHCDPAWEPGTRGSWRGLLSYQVIYYLEKIFHESVMWLERAGPGSGVGAVEGSGEIFCTSKTKCGGN